MTAEEIAALYFEQLDMREVRNLYRIYQYDFLLFGYSFAFEGETFPQGSDAGRC